MKMQGGDWSTLYENNKRMHAYKVKGCVGDDPRRFEITCFN